MCFTTLLLRVLLFRPTSCMVAVVSGGMFFASCPKVDVRGTISFTDNKSVLDGGAISLTDPIEFYITDTSFSSNQAGSGGAVSLSATEPTTGGFERCVFDRNLASNGGALYLITGDTSDTAAPNFVLGSVFRNNVAGENKSHREMDQGYNKAPS